MYALYINHVNEKARLHYEDCDRLRQKGGGGSRGEYRYFEDYEEAWDYINSSLDDYNCNNCKYCNPE